MYSSNNPNTVKESHTHGQPATVNNMPTPLYTPHAPPLYNHPAPPIGQPILQNWSTGLCGCCEDVPGCCLTFWCPCITFGQIAEIVDKGSISCARSGTIYAAITWLTCCACLYSGCYRSRMRQQLMLETSPCDDCVVHFFCEPLALCQEHRHLKNRGYEMSLGWQGNADKQNQGVTTAPMMESGMRRWSG